MRTLGRSDIQVAPLCFGGNIFDWTTDEAASFKVLDSYVELGGNFIDTADVYSAWVPGHEGGESEIILGKWLRQRGNRERIVVATKVGSQMQHDPLKKGLSSRYIQQAVEASLRRLQTDYIDLYQAHYDDLEAPQEETLAAFAELVKAGKVRAIGASNFTVQRLASALKLSKQQGYPRFESLQPHYNLIHRKEFEEELEPLCIEQQISVIPYSSLASGFLTGKYRQGGTMPKTPRAQSVQSRHWSAQNFQVLDQLDKVAAHFNATPAQVALAWMLARPSITAPIASATTIEQTHELMGALKLQLDQEALSALAQVSNGL